MSRRTNGNPFNMEPPCPECGRPYPLPVVWQSPDTYPNDGTVAVVWRPHAPVKRMLGLDWKSPDKHFGKWANTRPDEPVMGWARIEDVRPPMATDRRAEQGAVP